MAAYLFKRILLVIPTLVGVSFITFGVIHLAPGDPASMSSGGDVQLGGITKQAVEHFRQEMNLDKPLPVQYWLWLARVVSLDFGTSWSSGRPVIEQIASRLPVTMALGGSAIIFACFVGVWLGVLSAVGHGSFRDRILTVGLFLLYSIPPFWLGTLCVLFLGGGKYWNMIPVQGLMSSDFESLSFLGKFMDLAWHAVTPVVLLGYASLATISRYSRSGMLGVLRQDFIRTARAKGLSERNVIYKHALRNALLPVLSHLGMIVPFLVGGSVIVERVFGIPGMGELMFQAILGRDYSLIMGVSTVTALITMLGLLVTDVLYAVVEPRISYEARQV